MCALATETFLAVEATAMIYAQEMTTIQQQLSTLWQCQETS